MIKSTKKYIDSEFSYVGKCEIDFADFQKVIDNPEEFTSKNSCVSFYTGGDETFNVTKNKYYRGDIQKRIQNFLYCMMMKVIYLIS